MRITFSQTCASLDIDEHCGDVEDFRISLLKWFDCNGRHWIPWKLKSNGGMPNTGENLSVYGIWIAEVMLQQTQLKVVLPYWKRWMNSFPTLVSLANAPEQDVLIHWQGLGYYSRARRLHHSAKILLDLIGIENCFQPAYWPKDIKKWMELPGIGRSTAGSIVSSAFDLPTSLLDGNVKRIFSRLIANHHPPIKDELHLWQLSDYLLDKKFPRKFNQALMDLGATVCTPNNPNCVLCPVQQYCLAYSLYDPKDFPVKLLKKPLPLSIIGIGVIFNDSGEILIAQRLENKSMGGMWEFPGGKKEKNELIETTIAREIQEEIGIDVSVGERLIEFNHAYSHRKFQFIVHICQLLSGHPEALQSQQLRWIKPHQLSDYPFPGANVHIFAKLDEYLSLKRKIDDD